MKSGRKTASRILKFVLILLLTPLFAFIYASPFVFLRADIVMNWFVAATLLFHLPIIILTAYVSIKRTWSGIFGFEIKLLKNRLRVPGIIWTAYIFIKQTWANVLGIETTLLMNGFASSPFLQPVNEAVIRRQQLEEKKKVMLLVVMTYLYIVYMFAVGYFYSFQNIPNSFRDSGKLGVMSSFYFSLITISTVGYGDIIPVGSWSRLLVMSEILTGHLFTVFIFSSLAAFLIKRS